MKGARFERPGCVLRDFQSFASDVIEGVKVTVRTKEGKSLLDRTKRAEVI